VALATLELNMRRRSHLDGLLSRRPARPEQKGTTVMAFPALNHVALTVRDPDGIALEFFAPPGK
jgi:hypothetical protein